MRQFLVLLLFLTAPVYAQRTRAAGQVVTFNEAVRVFQTHCQECHRPGGVGPFSLTTYTDAKPHAAEILINTTARKMPPWKPADGCGEFLRRPALSPRELQVIRDWVKQGALEGDPKQLPAPIQFSSDWPLGNPDLILSQDAGYTPPPGQDTFRCFTLSHTFPHDEFVRAVDVRPLARELVHHVSLMVDTTGKAAQLDAADPEPGFDLFAGGLEIQSAFLGTWVPNAVPFELPAGAAIRIPAGAQVFIQVHYHSDQMMVRPDQTQVALYFAREPVVQLVRNGQFYVDKIDLPAGAKNVVVETSKPVPGPMEIFAILPHMHYLGRSITAFAVRPDGTRECLVQIPDWDIHWQGAYRYSKSLLLPAGSSIQVTGVYDNSADNPNNPSNPPRDVRQGYRSTDEMCGVEVFWAPPVEPGPL